MEALAPPPPTRSASTDMYDAKTLLQKDLQERLEKLEKLHHAKPLHPRETQNRLDVLYEIRRIRSCFITIDPDNAIIYHERLHREVEKILEAIIHCQTKIHGSLFLADNIIRICRYFCYTLQAEDLKILRNQEDTLRKLTVRGSAELRRIWAKSSSKPLRRPRMKG